MRCDIWNDRIIGRIYGEIDAADDAELTRHLAGCADCRATLDAFRGIRSMLGEHEPPVPETPKVVVLREPARLRPALLAASILGAVLLAGAGAGAGYGWARRAVSAAPPTTAAAAGPTPAEMEALVRREVDRRWAALEARRAEPPASTAGSQERGLTRDELRAELAKFERTVNGARASDLDYVLDQIAASEARTGSRIGQTNQALRYVALASNPQVSEQ
ncbi:MAG TPA: zf-HC2 domain-containing protein [Candidatus Polarisedimenticolaceae bacterium]|nr:zf-HC2 domain-containing protein [Candidatus Polarisedimenticolaceae bacterium]